MIVAGEPVKEDKGKELKRSKDDQEDETPRDKKVPRKATQLKQDREEESTVDHKETEAMSLITELQHRDELFSIPDGFSLGSAKFTHTCLHLVCQSFCTK